MSQRKDATEKKQNTSITKRLDSISELPETSSTPQTREGPSGDTKLRQSTH